MVLNDYLGLIGYSGLALGLVFTVIGLFAGCFSLLKKDLSFDSIHKLILIIQFICLSLAVLSLGSLLLNNAFEYPIVFDTVEKSMPWIQKLSGLWSGQSSSLLFWSFILSGVILLISGIIKKLINDQFSTIVTLILGIALIFFLAPVLILSNPFEKLWQLADSSTLVAVFAPTSAGLIVPVHGVGMNPSLRHIAMLLHPPFLYLGLVGFFVPYAVSMTALIMGDKQTKWVKLLLPITLVAWVFLTLGMVLGSWWAYTILGWRGYWGWDAVEIAGLLPWLLSFGLIHSLRMQLGGKKYLRWIIVFSGLIFISILSGILITRSGILESVHAYSAGVMGPVLSIFIAINFIFFVFLIIKRFHLIKVTDMQTRRSFSDLLIRIFNYLILALVFLYFIGQTLPLSSEFITGEQLNWTSIQYERYSSPFLLLLLIVTALCPLAELLERQKKRFFQELIFSLATTIIVTLLSISGKEVSFAGGFGFFGAIFLIVTWSGLLSSQFLLPLFSNSNNFQQKRRRLGLGTVLIHIGMGLMAFGIMGQEALSETFEIKVSVKEQADVDGIKFSIQDNRQFISPEGTTFSEVSLLINEDQNGDFILKPDLEYYPKIETLYARPAISSNLRRDIQIILNNWNDGEDGKFGVHLTITPLMIWVWIGGIVMSFGGIFTLAQQWIFRKKN